MTYNLTRTQLVRDLLAHEPDITERKMFGSIGFMMRGKLCIGVGDQSDHVMMVRVGKDSYDAALQRPGAHPAIMRGREMKGYVFLDEDAVRTSEQLRYWVTAAIGYVKALD